MFAMMMSRWLAVDFDGRGLRMMILLLEVVETRNKDSAAVPLLGSVLVDDWK